MIYPKVIDNQVASYLVYPKVGAVPTSVVLSHLTQVPKKGYLAGLTKDESMQMLRDLDSWGLLKRHFK